MISTAVLVTPITIDDLVAEAGDLFKLHFDEIRKGQDTPHEVDPDWSQYRGMERLGLLTVYGVRDTLADDLPLVGYMVAIFVKRHLHYPMGYGIVDVVFVHPDYRRSAAAREMAKKTRTEMKEKGASELVWHAVPGSAMHTIAERSDKFQLRDYHYSETL